MQRDCWHNVVVKTGLAFLVQGAGRLSIEHIELKASVSSQVILYVLNTTLQLEDLSFIVGDILAVRMYSS